MKHWISAALMWSLTALLIFGASSATVAGADEQKPLVLVAGATGRTGQEAVRQLLARNYRVRGLVRDRARAEQMFGASIEYAVGDVREPATLSAATKGATYVVCAIGSSREDPTNTPEQVDYLGVRNLVDAAKATGVKQFALMSAMGVTWPEEQRYTVPGRPARTGLGQWKLKGENHLRASGLTYTIVRPAGLSDKPAGQQGIKAQQGDKPLEGNPRLRMIPRADVAAILVHALGNPDAYNKTFGVMGDPSTAPADWSNFFKLLAKDKR